jgi:hypothetical protein
LFGKAFYPKNGEKCQNLFTINARNKKKNKEVKSYFTFSRQKCGKKISIFLTPRGTFNVVFMSQAEAKKGNKHMLQFKCE